MCCALHDRVVFLVYWGQISQSQFRDSPPNKEVKPPVKSDDMTITLYWLGKGCEIGYKLVKYYSLYRNYRKSHTGITGFRNRWVWVTSTDGRHCALFQTKRYSFWSQLRKIHCQAQKCSPESLVFGGLWFMRNGARYFCSSWASCSFYQLSTLRDGLVYSLVCMFATNSTCVHHLLKSEWINILY